MAKWFGRPGGRCNNSDEAIGRRYAVKLHHKAGFTDREVDDIFKKAGKSISANGVHSARHNSLRSARVQPDRIDVQRKRAARDDCAVHRNTPTAASKLHKMSRSTVSRDVKKHGIIYFVRRPLIRCNHSISSAQRLTAHLSHSNPLTFGVVELCVQIQKKFYVKVKSIVVMLVNKVLIFLKLNMLVFIDIRKLYMFMVWFVGEVLLAHSLCVVLSMVTSISICYVQSFAPLFSNCFASANSFGNKIMHRLTFRTLFSDFSNINAVNLMIKCHFGRSINGHHVLQIRLESRTYGQCYKV